ncbi:MAG: Dabb family protein [Acidobacteriia bacterium]|nr:Dabb family protein [Terriglobia bacterium]
MKQLFNKKIAALVLGATLVFSAGVMAANKFGKPKSVIHVVTVKWKEGTTPEQIKAAITGVETVAANYVGIKNVWTRAIKVQGQGYTHAFVMEFESEDALTKYTGSDAQKEWYKVYLAIRGESTTHDITN